MKQLFLVLLCIGCVHMANAEECELAVDVADSMNVNASNECEDKESGLNGVVRGWFKRDEASSSSTSSVQATADRPRGSAKMSPPVKDAESLAKARYQLLSVIGQECVQGFRVTDELFLPVEDALTIRLRYECL